MKYTEPKKITLKQIQKDFEIYLYARGNAKSTQIAYQTDILQFITFLKKRYCHICYIDDIDIRILEAYKLFLIEKVKNKDISSKTKDRKLDSLTILYSFLESHHNKNNLMNKISFKRTKKNDYSSETQEFANKITFLTKEESNLLLEKIKSSSNVNKIRDYCMVLFMLTTSTRGCSVRESKWEDLDIFNKKITIRNNKGQKCHVVPISSQLCEAFSSYHAVSTDTSEKIFLSNKGYPISKTAFNNVVKRILSYIDINEPGISSHIFRHTFVMNMIANNISSEKIIRFTGHSSVDELKPYIHYCIEDLRNCISSVS